MSGIEHERRTQTKEVVPVAEFQEGRIKEIIAKQLEVSIARVTPEARLAQDLKADSLDMVELTMALEDELSINVSDEESKTIETVGDLLKFLRSKKVA